MRTGIIRISAIVVALLWVHTMIYAQFVQQFIKTSSNEQLCDIIQKYYPNNEIEIFVSKSEYKKNDTIELMGIDKFPIPFDGNVIFVDLHPGENWGHECEYLIVSSDNQQIHCIKNTMPPKHLTDSFSLYQQGKYTFGELIKPSIHSNYFKTSHQKKNMLQRTNTTHEQYAVIISGGGDVYNNHVRYWNDCSAVYQTLKNNGFTQNHIYVAMSDGTNPAWDLRTGEYSYISSPLDLDGDNINDIQYPADYDHIEMIFDSLAGIMSSDDDLFVFVTDHGGHIYGNMSYIVLWNGGTLHDYAFAQMIRRINARTINIVMEQCYSGGFVDDLRGMENLVITTACAANEKSYAMSMYSYDEYIYYWLTAVNGTPPFCLYPYYAPLPMMGNPDSNQDGYISMGEAYQYATAMDSQNEHPIQESYPYCLAQSLCIGDLLNLCGGSLLVDGSDLYIKDNIADLGEEPNTTTAYSWISEDIWFEENGQRVNTLMSGQDYDVCVRVRNRGFDLGTDQATLYVHWAKAHIGGSWPWGWTDELQYDCRGTLVRRGEMFGMEELPRIESGASYVAKIPWTTPESEEYSSCLEFEGENIAELWHYCILARIVDEQEQPDETITDMNFRDFVLNHNNVASRNVTIMDVQNDSISEPRLTGFVGITNPTVWEDSGPYHLICNVWGPDSWEQSAIVQLTFSEHFFDNQTHLTWFGCEESGSNGCFNLGVNAYFDSIYFSSNDNQLYPIKVEVIYRDTYEAGNYPEFTISLELVNSNNGEMVGGEMFQFRNERPDLANVGENLFNQTMQKSMGQTSIPQETSVYIYNIQGQHLMNVNYSKEWLSKLPAGIYIFKEHGESPMNPIKIIK